MRKKIDGTDSTMDVVVKMAEGNPGGLSVLTQMIPFSFLEILSLDDMNIRGSQIWVGYKDHCGEDLAKFIECIIQRDQDMVDTINRECHRPDLVALYGDAYGHEAVTSGASFNRPGTDPSRHRTVERIIG